MEQCSTFIFSDERTTGKHVNRYACRPFGTFGLDFLFTTGSRPWLMPAVPSGIYVLVFMFTTGSRPWLMPVVPSGLKRIRHFSVEVFQCRAHFSVVVISTVALCFSKSFVALGVALASVGWQEYLACSVCRARPLLLNHDDRTVRPSFPVTCDDYCCGAASEVLSSSGAGSSRRTSSQFSTLFGPK